MMLWFLKFLQYPNNPKHPKNLNNPKNPKYPNKTYAYSSIIIQTKGPTKLARQQ